MINMEKDVRRNIFDGKHVFLTLAQTLLVFDWLVENGHPVSSWELYSKNGNKAVRTTAFGGEDSPIRDEGADAPSMRARIRDTIEQQGDPFEKQHALLIMLNLKNDFFTKLKEKKLPMIARVFTGIMAVFGAAMFVGGIVALVVWDEPFNEWRLLVTLMLGGPVCSAIFGYATITGVRDIYFLDDPLNAKKKVKTFVTIETGEPRWPADR